MEEQNNLWTTVDNSSLISAYKYNPEEEELDVEFKSNGAKYRYSQVWKEVGNNIKNQVAPGKFIQKNVIKAGNSYVRLN